MLKGLMLQMKNSEKQLSALREEMKDDNKQLRNELQDALTRGLNEVQARAMQYTDKQCGALREEIKDSCETVSDALKGEIKDSCVAVSNTLRGHVKVSCEVLKSDIDEKFEVF